MYKEKISSLKKGTTDAELYHRLISHAVARVFRGSLRNMKIKVNIDGGIKIIDTVFTNCAKDGFFQNLKSKVECSYPTLAVKVYLFSLPRFFNSILIRIPPSSFPQAVL